MIFNPSHVILISVISALLPLWAVGQGLCSDATTCAECMDASPPSSSQATFCTWFEERGYCETGCGMDGCGASACAADIDTCHECLATVQHQQYAWSPSSGESGECLTSCDEAPQGASCFPGTTYGTEVCDCSVYTSCDECVDVDECAWSVDSCLDSCDDAPAGASCFPGADYGPDICPVESESVEPSSSPSSPSSPSGDCSSATTCAECMDASPPSSSQATFCTWFEDIGYCETGCGMEGCGASACAADIDTCHECLATIQHKQYAWSPSSGESGECLTSCDDAPADASCFPGTTYGTEVCGCSGFTSCSDCVDVDKCAWSVDSCLDSCDDAPADASCFPGADYGPEVCPDSTNVEPASRPSGECSSATTCAECMDASPPSSSQATFCTWFEDIGYCETGCGMDGCGASACAADIDTCHECLATIQHKQYAWSPSSGEFGECLTSCDDAPADASCFPGKTYGTEVCECSGFTSCADCVDVDKCAWSGDTCLDSCDDAPADASCFPGDRYGPEICPQSASVEPAGSSSAKISVSFALFTLLIGHCVALGWNQDE